MTRQRPSRGDSPGLNNGFAPPVTRRRAWGTVPRIGTTASHASNLAAQPPPGGKRRRTGYTGRGAGAAEMDPPSRAVRRRGNNSPRRVHAVILPPTNHSPPPGQARRPEVEALAQPLLDSPAVQRLHRIT